MTRQFRRRRVAPAVLVALLAITGTASAAVVGLPADGSQVNDDPAVGIDPGQDAGLSDVVGGSLVPGTPNVPWAAFEQKTGASQQIFVRAFKNGRWVTQGQSLNIQSNQEAEAPSIDFAGTGRKVPWTAWYEPNSNLPGGATNIFASRFNAAANVWVPEGQDRTASLGVPSLNIHTDRTAENPALPAAPRSPATTRCRGSRGRRRTAPRPTPPPRTRSSPRAGSSRPTARRTSPAAARASARSAGSRPARSA